MIHSKKQILGSEVHYWIHNPGQNKTIIAVHGFRGNHKALTDFASYFEHTTVILFDLPGHGQSSNMRPRHTMQNFARFLSEFINSFQLEQFDLWGHSFGGSIALLYASHHPVRLDKLVLVSPAVSVSGPLATLGTIYYKFARILPLRTQKAWLSSTIVDHISGELLIKHVSSQRKSQLLKAGHRNLQEINPPVIIDSSLSYFKINCISLAKQIKAPVLIIAGQLDQLVPLSRLEMLFANINNGTFKILPEHGHLSPLEIPGNIAHITEKFINQTH
ncbi:MAG: alpha/beta hydrolase [Candidatus Saccharimonadales bacterium]